MKLLIFIKSILIGIALVVPGLSGSIFMVVVGLYDKIMDAITNLRKDIKTNALFLLPVVLGIGVGILVSTKGVLYIYEKYMWQSTLFFIGLILGSFPLILQKMDAKQKQNRSAIHFCIAIAAFLLLLLASNWLVSGSSADTIAIRAITSVQDFIVITWAGLFSCSLMMIPGVSGSVNLMVIGQYGTIYNAAGSIIDGLKALIDGDMAAFGTAFGSVLILLPFMLGAVIGIGLIAKLITILLKRFESYVYYGVLGIVCACVVSLFQNGVLNPALTLPAPLTAAAIGATCAVAGIVLTVALKADK